MQTGLGKTAINTPKVIGSMTSYIQVFNRRSVCSVDAMWKFLHRKGNEKTFFTVSCTFWSIFQMWVFLQRGGRISWKGPSSPDCLSNRYVVLYRYSTNAIIKRQTVFKRLICNAKKREKKAFNQASKNMFDSNESAFLSSEHKEIHLIRFLYTVLWACLTKDEPPK